MPVQNVSCGGGLNVESAIYELKAGEAAALLNVEVDTSGSYTTMAGCEKLDGRAEPNKAIYKTLKLASVVGIALGAVITAVPSGWSATVIGIDGDTIGVVKDTGTLTLSDTILSNAVVSLPIAIEARSYASHRAFRSYAQSVFRALIQPVPGVNEVRGVVIYKGDIYAFRDHSDNTTCRMYKATTSGWTEITTSGFLLKNGRYEFRIHNFTAGAGTQKLIIVNGVNKACSYNGTTVAQLSTGMTIDVPSSVEVLPSSVLTLGYDNGSVMTSKVGDPTDFTVGSGGTELGMSDKVISLSLQPDGKVAIFCEKTIKILSGKTPATFDISTFNTDAGAVKGSVVNIGDSIFLSQSGLTRLARSQVYGAFEMVGIDKKVKRLLNNPDALFSLAVHRKNQYRIFTNAGFIGFTLAGTDVVGSFTGTYPVKMVCGFSGEINSEEYVLMGGADGYVYRADVGQSQAGLSYTRLSRMAYNDLGGGQQRKKFKRLVINADSPRLVDATISVDLDYSSGDAPRQNTFSVTAGGSEMYLGTIVLGKSVFGSADDAINQIYLSGVGRSISVSMLMNSGDADPVRFGGYSIEYEARAKTR